MIFQMLLWIFLSYISRTNLILYILTQFHDTKHAIVPELTNYQCAPIF